MFRDKWGPCQLDMLCAQDGDGGEGLRICRVGKATRGDRPSWDLGKGLTSSQPKKVTCYEM